MELNKKTVVEAIEKVVNKLMNLTPPEIPQDMETIDEASISKGIIARDFGIKEWDWPQGVGIYGLKKFSDYKKNNQYDEFFRNWYINNINFGLPSRNVNTTVPLLTLVDILPIFEDRKAYNSTNINEQTLEELCKDWANWLIKDLPKTRDGGFQHVTSNERDRKSVNLHDSELWADTLFMMVLFLNKMGVKYNRMDWIEEANYQMLVHIKYLFDKKTGLLHHGWSFNENGNFGDVFWCRGNSWYTLGAMEFISINENSLNEACKKHIINTYIDQVDSLLKLQSENGLWHTVLDDKTSYLETSGSASIAAGILKGVANGILSEKYRLPALKAITAILNNIAEDGTVLGVSGGTGVGYNKDHYKNIITAPMAYGQSLSIIALTESLYHI